MRKYMQIMKTNSIVRKMFIQPFLAKISPFAPVKRTISDAPGACARMLSTLIKPDSSRVSNADVKKSAKSITQPGDDLNKKREARRFDAEQAKKPFPFPSSNKPAGQIFPPSVNAPEMEEHETPVHIKKIEETEYRMNELRAIEDDLKNNIIVGAVEDSVASVKKEQPTKPKADAAETVGINVTPINPINLPKNTPEEKQATVQLEEIDWRDNELRAVEDDLKNPTLVDAVGDVAHKKTH